MNLNDRYQDELRDPLFGTKVASYKADPDSENAIDPWATLVDKGGSVEDTLFAEDCAETQQDFFFKHFGKGT